jgi:hypothetical protein
MMARTMPRARKRTVRRVVIAVMAGLAVLGSLAYVKRYDIALRFMQGSAAAREMAILTIQERAAQVIETEVTMTAFQKIFSALTGRRSEDERQTDALDDVRAFNESGFANRQLSFAVAHGLDSLHGSELHGFDFALVWNGGTAAGVLAEFDVNFLTQRTERMLIHQESSYFTDLGRYIETKARED